MIQATAVRPGSNHGRPPQTGANSLSPTQRGGVRDGEVLVRQAVTLIRRQLQKLPSVEMLAAELHVDRGTLHRHFRRGLRMSVSDAIRRIRLAEAKRLLAETELPIAAVANQVGYSSQAKMSDHFRRLLDVTPSSYRRTTRASSQANGVRI